MQMRMTSQRKIPAGVREPRADRIAASREWRGDQRGRHATGEGHVPPGIVTSRPTVEPPRQSRGCKRYASGRRATPRPSRPATCLFAAGAERHRLGTMSRGWQALDARPTLREGRRAQRHERRQSDSRWSNGGGRLGSPRVRDWIGHPPIGRTRSTRATDSPASAGARKLHMRF